MNIQKSNLQTILIVAFIICMMYSAYVLFIFQDELIYTYGVLDLSVDENASSVLNRLYITIGFTLLLGLSIIIFTTKYDKTEVIYIEKREDDKGGEGKDKSVAAGGFDLAFYQNLKETMTLDEKIETGFKRFCNDLKVGQGAFYILEQRGRKEVFALKEGFALNDLDENKKEFSAGDGLIGQVIKDGKTVTISEVPENYVRIISGLGSSSPGHLIITPVLRDEKVVAVLELAMFAPPDTDGMSFLNKCIEIFSGWLKDSAEDEKNETADKEEKEAKKVIGNKRPGRSSDK